MDWLTSTQEPTSAAAQTRPERLAWHILIVDDEEGVHSVTKLALKGFEFDGIPVEFLDAYSGAEAIEIVRQRDDIAVILMDVVMDTDDDGLRAINAIRQDVGNKLARIILRTGHPGQAPEDDIIREYDIDDYKCKTELTRKRLSTSVYAAIRSYRDMRTLERSRAGLESVIRASTDLLAIHGINEFASGVLIQMAALLHASKNGFVVRKHGFASLDDALEPPIIAAIGKFESARGLKDIAKLDEAAFQYVDQRFKVPGTEFTDGTFVHCIESPSCRHLLIYIESDQPWSSLDRHVLELFSHNVAVGLDRLYLNQQLMQTQKNLIIMLGEAIEKRSMEAGKHVHRVAEYSALLAKLSGLGKDEIETLRMAAPLHDIGKIAIEDAILNKPGRHTEVESERMREHAIIGANILSGHELPILDAASHVAAGHHENWDGTGYPHQLAGQDIHIYGRIVALTDVFDALRSERCYKAAWPLDEVLKFVRNQRGIKFDPELVDLLLENIDQFVAIGESLPD